MISLDAPEADPVLDHRRQWRSCRYVYPVVSRRARGLSIGVNVNLDKACNFACLYCQIDRSARRKHHAVDLDVLERELLLALDEALSGRLWDEDRFASTAAALRRVNDIAFSGDGEPTCLDNFDRAVAVAADARRRKNAPDVKIVVITNSTRLDSDPFARALPILAANNGEIWAKLDAGTDAFFQRVNRPHPVIPLDRIVSNIARVAREQPVVIQSLFFRLDGSPPPPAEIDAYCDRLNDILAAGGKVRLVQAHTVARAPASPSVTSLDEAELDRIADRIRTRAAVRVETFYSHS